MIAADPGLLRLLMAARGTGAVFLMTVAAAMLGRLPGTTPLDFAPGVILSLMAPFLMREPTRRQRQRTLLFLAVPAAVATVATTLLHGRGPAGDSFFLVLVFVCFLFQARSPLAVGMGLIAVVTSYVGLYLNLPPATLPAQLLSIAVAVPVTALACFVLLPLRPAVTLRRMVQSVQARTARVLRDARGLAEGGPARGARLYRSLARLNEAALAADDQLGVLDAAGGAALRHHLMALELAAARLATAPLDGIADGAGSDGGAGAGAAGAGTGAGSGVGPRAGTRAGLGAGGRHAARLRVTERRLRENRWSPRDRRPADDAAPAALADITRAAAALDDAPAPAVAAYVPRPPAPPGPLAWRIALRVTLASALAMAGGMMLSHDRWFWAVITVYVVFLNTRSRGDTIYKGVQRLGGTLMGLAAGMVLADLLRGDIWAQAAVVYAAIFGMYYLFLVSYTLGIFCVTVLLGSVYSLFGAATGPLLMLRLEETAIGAAAAILVAALVMPVRTRAQVERSGVAVLTALAAAVGACGSVLAGQAGAPLLAIRALDRQVADLRLALLPLTIGRIFRRAAVERPVQALLDCVHWTRVLAVSATGADAAAAAHAALLERRVAGLAAGVRAGLTTAPAEPAAADPAVRSALDALDRATAALAERLAISAMHAFRLEA